MRNKSCLHNRPRTVRATEPYEKHPQRLHSGTITVHNTMMYYLFTISTWPDVCAARGPRIGLYIRVCLFPSALRNSLTHPPNLLPPHRYISRPCGVLTHSTPHKSHLEFFTCSLVVSSPPSCHFSPSSLQQYKQWRDQKVRRGAKSLCRVSIWPRFRWAPHIHTQQQLHTHTHTHKKNGQVNMHTL